MDGTYQRSQLMWLLYYLADCDESGQYLVRGDFFYRVDTDEITFGDNAECCVCGQWRNLVRLANGTSDDQ